MGAADPREEIAQVASATVAGRGMVVEEVVVTPAGSRRVVRVTVDRDVTALDPTDHTSVVPPLDLDDVAEASRLVGEALEASDVLGDTPYVLEVSSPGVGRPLTAPRHFRRNVSRLICVQAGDGRSATGRLAAVGGDGIVVVMDDGSSMQWPFGDIERAVVQVEFTRNAD